MVLRYFLDLKNRVFKKIVGGGGDYRGDLKTPLTNIVKSRSQSWNLLPKVF